MPNKQKRGLTDEEIKKLLQELSENESDGDEISNFSVETEDEFQTQTISESEDSEVNEKELVRNKRAKMDQVRGRVPAYNVLNETAGPIFFAKSRVSEDKVSSVFKLFIDDDILLQIKKCIESEAHWQLGNKDWKLPLAKLDAFVAILYVRGVIGAKGLDLYSLWSEA
ncbi:uncharacterized protein LOC118190580 [Stegodyphus dumicola]|uniref:uncharacterized protein LOC118190580 n=1 Tax=Stegodyphus dumicola TaxID=202533 RepID=UPI0015AFFC14|nr:uncharacterized protein LOC118190580 [Stegodyphus dumicola]